MHTLSIQLRYRPIKIGWCVRSDDFEALRHVVKLTFTMWGGCYNPIIPIDKPDLADALIRLFRVDVLAPRSHDEAIKLFVNQYKHLPWPFFDDEFFLDSGDGNKTPQVVDISHPMEELHDENVRNNPDPQFGIDLISWDANDPLADLFLLTFGNVPNKDEIGIDYADEIEQMLNGNRIAIDQGGEFPLLSDTRGSLRFLNKAYLESNALTSQWGDPGFYIGCADRFDDLVNFWNLRAADILLLFYDPRYAGRCETLNAEYARWAKEQSETDRLSMGVGLWHRREQELVKPSEVDAKIIDCSIDDAIWNGFNVRVPFMYFGAESALATIGDVGKTPTISFALAERPFAQDVPESNEHYVLSVGPGIGLFNDERATLHTPFIPELNEFYGRHCYFEWNRARAEPDGLGIITETWTSDLSLRSVSVVNLMSQIFGAVGIDASPSRAGLVGASLIRQMGGLEGCRPFKIAGVRKLIESYRPDETFTRPHAKMMILGEGTNRPLSDYNWLHIEPRKIGSTLTNDAVFSYLLDRGVFRAGLKFACPSCQLDFWRSLDEVKTEIDCEYCGHKFNISRQLRDRDWAFRRSGLFGRSDHQEGGIPVTLTLQQLLRASGLSASLYVTGMELKPDHAKIDHCETDFVVLIPRVRDSKIQIAIGECKARMPIEADDVRKLKKVAEAFPADRYDVYIVFAKLASFTSDEIEHIKTVNDRHHLRAIMLTDRELEPYLVYERTAEEFDINKYAVDFGKMAIATDRVFFRRLRREPGPTNASAADARESDSES